MELKYAAESDFVSSFLDHIIIQELAPHNYGLIKDSLVLSKCTNQHPVSLKLADCEGTKERIQAFISANDKFDKLKSNSLSSCSEHLIKYHHSTFMKGLDKSSVFNYGITKNIESNFKSCFKEANSELI